MPIRTAWPGSRRGSTRSRRATPEIARPDYERLAALWQQLRSGGGTADETETLQRIVHDFKGQGGSVGYPLISDIAALLGEVLRAADLASELARRAVDQHIAAIGAVLHHRMTGDGGAQGKALKSTLQALAAKCLAAPPGARRLRDEA
ncbi:MAG: Hpt domain-containing protein [Aliidongia sp.]